MSDGVLGRLPRLLRNAGLCILAAWSAADRLAAQPVQGDVRSVGFRGRGTTRFVVREGAWTPVLLELTVPGDQHFEGTAQIERRDLDHDRVIYLKRPLTLTAGAGLQRVWCYAVVSPQDPAGGRLGVEIVAADGARVATFRSPAFELVSPDTQVILDLSSPFLPAVAALDTGSESYASLMWGTHRFYRSVCVASLEATDVPDEWFGLEAADTIVWDDPDPRRLSDIQLEALVRWVRHGGRLVLGLGPAASRLRGTPLEPLLPVQLTGRAVEVKRLPRLFEAYAVSRRAEFRAPVLAWIGPLRSHSTTVFEDRAPGAGVFPLLAMRMAGSGRVIACAVRLRDLTSVGYRSELMHLLFDLNRTPDDFLKNEAQAMAIQLGRTAELHAAIVEPIEFRATASVQMLAAFSFVFVYIAVATFASWAWLRRRKQTHLSWAVFAGIAVIGSVLSLGAVRLARGIVETVHTISFVDLEAGSHAARAHVLAGLRSPRRRRVKVSLGEAPESYIRPLGSGRELTSAYATPTRYHVLPQAGRIDDVLVRATLKQFEGFLSTTSQGTIDARILVDPRSGRIRPESWIRNNLSTPLRGGVLLYVDPRLRDQGRIPARVAGVDHWQRPTIWEQKTVPVALNALAIELPSIGPGQTLRGLGARAYERYDQQRLRWQQRGAQPRQEPVLETLWHMQTRRWITGVAGLIRLPVGALDRTWAASLLASTRDLYLHTRADGNFASVGVPISTAGLPPLDVTHWLSRDTAVLLLLCDAPAPIPLVVDDAPVQPSAGRTLYRVRVPVEYTAAPATRMQP